MILKLVDGYPIDDVGYLDSQSVHGLNLYAYCRNNPVMYTDRDGTFPVLIVLGSILLGGLISGAFAVASESDSNNYLGSFVGGFINGAIGTAGLAAALATGGLSGFGIAFASGFAGGFLGDVTSQQISYGNVDWTQSFIAGWYIRDYEFIRIFWNASGRINAGWNLG